MLNLVSTFNPQNTTLARARQIAQSRQNYESDSTLRKFHAGHLPKTLIKQAKNDDFWRVEA